MLPIALLVAASGCPRPAAPTTPHEDPRRALRMHRSLQRTVLALRAEARVDQRGAQGRIRGTVLLLLQRPDRVRFDALTQFGPAAILTSDGTIFQLLDQREDRFLQGPTCPANIARLLGIAMSGDEVARFLVGDTPRLEAERASMTYDEGYRIELHHEDGRRQLIVFGVREGDEEEPPARQHLRLRKSVMYHPDGRVDWRATYDEYRVVRDPNDEEGRGVAFPFSVRFEDPDLEADTLLRMKEVEVLAEPPDSGVFRQSPPPGMRAEEILCN
ncbi:MAG: hypothetical protein AAGE52_06430 [Myxococcota bacterium]